MSNFILDDLSFSLDLECEINSTLDSNDLEEVCKKIFSIEQLSQNQIQNLENEKQEDELRYFALETANSPKISSPLNSITGNIFTVFKDEEKNLNTLLHQKRGRKKGNDNKRTKYKNHDKYDKDNSLTKIQVHYFNFIIHFLNTILPIFKFNKREHFYIIDYRIKQKVNKEYSDYLKTLKLADIVKMKISDKCCSIEKNFNIKLYNEVKTIPVINNILEENYLSFFQNVYYKSERKINLAKYGLNIDIILPDKIKMYNDILKSFEDKNCITLIQKYVNDRYFDNKLFFYSEK